MTRPAILFLCVQNAGRSQMAAAWARYFGGDAVDVLTGGSEPADRVHEPVVDAMREAGIDLRAAQPRRWTADDLQSADVIVTMGCGESCPVAAATRRVDWTVEDPSGQHLAGVRAIRDDLEHRVRALLDEMGIAIADPPA